MTARAENAKTLAALLGVGEAAAVELLLGPVVVTGDAPGHAFATELTHILERTIESVVTDVRLDARLEIVVGNASARIPGVRHLHVGFTDCGLRLDHKVIEVSRDAPQGHAVFATIGACFAAAAAVNIVVDGAVPQARPLPFEINNDDFLRAQDVDLETALEIGTAHLAGGGAIGNAFLWSLRRFDVRGTLYIADPDDVSAGNLNRCLWFTSADIGEPKANRLAAAAATSFPNLNLIPRRDVLHALQDKANPKWLERLIVGVDSRRARRALQAECPREVFDSSTTGIEEVVLHFNKQPSQVACMSCIYFEDAREQAHEEHVAESLGVTLDEVRANFVSAVAAKRIITNYPTLKVADIIGLAYDSLFKALCGEGVLRTKAGRDVLAPFAFVSVLAGALLAVEFVRRARTGRIAEPFNYWRVSPWGPPVTRLKATRDRRERCQFCGDEVYAGVVRQLWG
ncbi:MAG: ThiF family adenylyltransferase [Deltaproteobacteria bacterium]|nr:ThiF family adenylyltransferase [Deltaproteobacteria bacterium]